MAGWELFSGLSVCQSLGRLLGRKDDATARDLACFLRVPFLFCCSVRRIPYTFLLGVACNGLEVLLTLKQSNGTTLKHTSDGLIIEVTRQYCVVCAA